MKRWINSLTLTGFPSIILNIFKNHVFEKVEFYLKLFLREVFSAKIISLTKIILSGSKTYALFDKDPSAH